MIYKYVGRTPKQVTELLLFTLLGLKTDGKNQSEKGMWPSMEGEGLWWSQVERGGGRGDKLADVSLFAPPISCQDFHVWAPQWARESGSLLLWSYGPRAGRRPWRTGLEGQHGKSPVNFSTELVELTLVICRCFTYTDDSLSSAWPISVWESHWFTNTHFIFSVKFLFALSQNSPSWNLSWPLSFLSGPLPPFFAAHIRSMVPMEFVAH